MGLQLLTSPSEPFLALLDYVSRAHKIAICPSQVRRPAVRPSVSQLSLNQLHGFLSKLDCSFSCAIRSDVFLNLKKKNITNIFRFVNMGVKISKLYFSYKSQPKAFRLFLTFLPNGPHKTTSEIFEILKIEILTNFIHFH